MKNKLEHEQQVAFVEWLQIMQQQKKVISFHAVSNGVKLSGTPAQRAMQVNNLKKEGYKSGVADMCVVLRNHVLFIEMKQAPKKLKNGSYSTSHSKPTDNQKEFIAEVNKSNVVHATVAWGSLQAITFVNKFLPKEENPKQGKLI